MQQHAEIYSGIAQLRVLGNNKTASVLFTHNVHSSPRCLKTTSPRWFLNNFSHFYEIYRYRLFCVSFWRQTSYSPDWPQTHYVADNDSSCLLMWRNIKVEESSLTILFSSWPGLLHWWSAKQGVATGTIETWLFQGSQPLSGWREFMSSTLNLVKSSSLEGV